MRLRYWIEEALKISGIIIAASLVYTVLMMGADAADDWRYYLHMCAIYLVMFGAFMNVVLGTSIYQVYVPLAISLGSTRKEVLYGIQCYRFLITFLVLLVAGILCVIAKEIQVWILMIIGISAFLFLSGMGAILGGLSNKLGKTALVLSALAVMLLFCGVIAAVVLGIVSKFIMRRVIVWLILGIGILVYSLCLVYEVKTIRKFSVK